MGVLIILVVSLTLFAHWPALSARALFIDDDQYLTENPLVRNPGLASAGRFFREVLEPSTVGGYYQPLAMISLMLDHALGGRAEDPRAFHRTSLLLHAANTALVVVFLHTLFGRPWAAAMAGLLFGVHPMVVESVAWVGERKTVLAAFFSLWSLIVYVRYARRPGGVAYGLCLLLYILALLSKPTSTPLPAVMLLLDYWPLNRLGRRALLEKLPFVGVGLVSGGITIISQARTARLDLPQSYPAWRVPLIVCHNIVFYLQKTVWPAGLSPYYDFPRPLSLSDPGVLSGVLGTCLLIPGLLLSLRRTRALLTGWLVFFVAVFPTLGVLGFTVVIASDKYAYLPAVGLLLILAWMAGHAWSATIRGTSTLPRVLTVTAVLAAALLLIVCTRRQLGHWQTTEALYDHAVRLAPRAPLLYLNRGKFHSGRGDQDRAMRDFTTAIELEPRMAEAYNNRGTVRAMTGSFDQAVADFSRALELNPGSAEAWYNRGSAWSDQGDFDRAIGDFDRAIRLKPGDARAYNNRGNALARKGSFHRAIEDFNRAIELDPGLAAAYSNRAAAYCVLREYGKASADVESCRRVGGTPSPGLVRLLAELSGRME